MVPRSCLCLFTQFNKLRQLEHAPTKTVTMGDDNHQRHRARIPNPQPYDESSKDLRYLKKWFNRLRNYTRQNDEFLVFFEGGEYENWTCKREDKTYGIAVEVRDAVGGAPAISAQIEPKL